MSRRPMNTYDCFVDLQEAKQDDPAERRREPRMSPVGETRVTVLFPWGAQDGFLWDVSRGGAKIYFPHGNYAADEEGLSEVLEERGAIRVLRRGDLEGRDARIAWHGLADRGGYIVGVELARSAPRFETGERPAPSIGLLRTFAGIGTGRRSL